MESKHQEIYQTLYNSEPKDIERNLNKFLASKKAQAKSRKQNIRQN